MNEQPKSINKSDAGDALKSIVTAQHQVTENYRSPLIFIIFSSLSYALMVFSWGMTEHENQWALGIYGGAIALFISIALSIYTLRIQGIKPMIIPKNKTDVKFHLVQAIIFAAFMIAGREIRLLGFEIAPYIAALASGTLFGLLLYKYPLGTMPIKGNEDE